MAVSKSNFFKDHYDWLVALVGIALLAGVGFLYVTSPDNSPEAARAACEDELKASNRPTSGGVPSAKTDIDTLSAVEDGFKNPKALDAASDVDGSFLASEHRVRCKKCRKPIPFKSTVCSWTDCGFEQPTEKPEDAERKGADLDDDGLPDVWEKKYGLDPNNRNDAEKDADGDLFTNLEEFTAKTNPQDPEDHPDYLDDLSIASALDTKTLPFCFSSYYQIRNGHRVTFEVTDGKYDSTANATEGEEILWTLRKSKTAKKEPSGWRLVKVEKKTKKVKKHGSAQELVVDDSSVVLQRISDKREFTVPKNAKAFPIEEQIDLRWNRGEGKTFTVTKGTVFELNKRTYEVKALRKGAVSIVDLKTNARKTLGEAPAEPKPEAKPTSAAKKTPSPTPSQSQKGKAAP